jgi:hypothetical protein
MTIEALRLDGNAIGGLFQEVFGVEMTAVPRACPTCRAVNMLGAYHLYRGAGVVLRCPVCSDMALTTSSLPGRLVVRMHGAWTLDVPRS